MRRRSVGPRAFTLIELLVVVAVMSILMSMLMPVVSDSLRRAGRIECLNRLRQLGLGCVYYSRDHSDFFPNYGIYGQWTGAQAPPELVRKYVDSLGDRKGIFLCPADTGPHNYWWWELKHPTLTECSFMWSEHVMTQDYTPSYPNFRNPTALALIADGWACPNGWTWITCLLPRHFPPTENRSRCDWEHDGGVNFVFADMHAEKIAHDKITRDYPLSDPR